MKTETQKRIFDKARQEQGFTSQEHLDAFYRYYDHRQTCPECQGIGGYGVLADNSLQPYGRMCEVSRKLDKELLEFRKQY